MAMSNMELPESELESLMVDGMSQTSLWSKRLVKLGFVLVAVVAAVATFVCLPNHAKPVKTSTEDSISDFKFKFAYCLVMRPACDAAFSEAADSVVDCQIDDAEADTVCETEGGGPEDPDADFCVAAFTGTIEKACNKAVKSGVNFTSTLCQNAVGCGCKANSVSEGGKCSKGQDSCCENGAVCGRYSKKKHKYQCCTNYNNVSGVAWCANGVGGACSNGEDDNCDSGDVCGRYNSQGNDYQCCAQSASHEVNGVDGPVTWCAKQVGAECSDGEDDNCMGTAACGEWAASSSQYACCTDYTVSSKGVTSCNSLAPLDTSS